MQKASHVIKHKPLPKLNTGAPIKASELVARRAAEAIKDFERLTAKREALIQQLVRANSKCWEAARRVQSYAKKIG